VYSITDLFKCRWICINITMYILVFMLHECGNVYMSLEYLTIWFM